MALTETQKLTIATILSVPVYDITYQISYLGATYATAAWETLVLAELTRWETAGVNFTNIEPNLKNFGAKISYAAAQNDIKGNLATLFQRADWGGSQSGRLQRG